MHMKIESPLQLVINWLHVQWIAIRTQVKTRE